MEPDWKWAAIVLRGEYSVGSSRGHALSWRQQVERAIREQKE
jgi:hypothetical protein